MKFTTEERFDFVLCQGILCDALDPSAMIRHVAGFLKKGGVLLCNDGDAVSVLPEKMRVLAAQLLIDPKDNVATQAEFLLPIFKPHLDTLKSMSRNKKQWIMESLIESRRITMPFIPYAISALDENFMVYGSSPKFFTDWRWYKDIVSQDGESNAFALNSYYANLHNLIDHDVLFLPREAEKNKQLLQLAEEFDKLCIQFQKTRESEYVPQALTVLEEIIANVSEIGTEAHSTVEKLQDGLQALQAIFQKRQYDFGRFVSLFGRGAQELSFIRIR